MRGSDIAYNPVFFGYVLITLNDVYCFVDRNQLPSNFEQHFAQNNVNIKVDSYANVQNVLTNLIEESKEKIWISPTSCYAFSALVPEKSLFQEVHNAHYSCLSFSTFFH